MRLPKTDVSPVAVQARCVRLSAKAADAASLAPVVETRALSRGDNELLIEVKAAAVNPSDVKAATGLMPYAVFPRTPGRDYAGVVIDGPAGLDRARGVRLVRRSRHPPRRHPCHASRGRG